MLTLKNKKMDRKAYLKVACHGKKYTNYEYCLLFIMTNFLPCLHKAHIVISSEFFFVLRLSRNESSIK